MSERVDSFWKSVGGPFSRFGQFCALDMELRPSDLGVKGRSRTPAISWIMFGLPGVASVLLHLPTELEAGRAEAGPVDFPVSVLHWMERPVFFGVGVDGDLSTIRELGERAGVQHLELQTLDLGTLVPRAVLSYGIPWTSLQALFLCTSGHPMVKGCMSRVPAMSTNLCFRRDFLAKGSLLYILNDILAPHVILACTVAARVILDLGTSQEEYRKISGVILGHHGDLHDTSIRELAREANEVPTVVQEEEERLPWETTPAKLLDDWNDWCNSTSQVLEVLQTVDRDFSMDDLNQLRNSNARDHCEVVKLLVEGHCQERLLEMGLGDCLDVLNIYHVLTDSTLCLKLLKWIISVSGENPEAKEALDLLSNPMGIGYIRGLEEYPTVTRYLGIARVPLSIRRKTAKMFGRTEWMEDYKATGRVKANDLARSKACQRYRKTGGNRMNRQRGYMNEWLVRKWAKKLRYKGLISENYYNIVLSDLHNTANYNTRNAHREKLVEIATYHGVYTVGPSEWRCSAEYQLARKNGFM